MCGEDDEEDIPEIMRKVTIEGLFDNKTTNKPKR